MPQPGTAMHDYVLAETASLATVLGALVGILPSIATLFAIVWYSILLYDRLIASRKRAEAPDLPDTDKKDSP